MTALPVIIVGAGVGGLAAALALAAAGQSIIVLERAPALSEVGAGLQVSPNAARRLAKWGALDVLMDSATAPESVIIRRAHDSAEIARVDLKDAQNRWGAPYLVAHRADLLAALAARVAQTPAISLRLGLRLIGWREEADRILIHGEDASHESIEMECAALIGADGLRSRVREGLALVTQDAPHYTGRTAWRALAPASAVARFAQSPHGNLWLGSGAHLVHYPLRDNRVVNIVAIVQDEWRDTSDPDAFWSAEGDAAFLAARFNEWCEPAKNLVASVGEWRRWPLYERKALREWARGRVALLGDSAHAMLPFLAQGAAQAIEDADALGAAFTTTSGDCVQALQLYQTTRIARATKIQNASRTQGKIYHLAGPAALARNMSMRLIGASGMARANDWIYKV